MAFSRGQLVVCIDQVEWEGTITKTLCSGPSKGEVCRVTDVFTFEGETGLALEVYNQNRCFAAFCFRPIKTSDADLFNSLLKTNPSDLLSREGEEA